MDLSAGVAALKKGKLVVYPTDTLYALGADVYNEEAVEKIFVLKHRPQSQPLPVAVSSLEEMEHLAYVDHSARRLVERFLPGPLTLVLRKKTPGLTMVTGGRKTIAIRIPDNEVALELLACVGPLTVTSANRHGEHPLLSVEDIRKQFQAEDVAVYLDCGRLEGKPSTIVDVTSGNPQVLRQGIITPEEIEDVI